MSTNPSRNSTTPTSSTGSVPGRTRPPEHRGRDVELECKACGSPDLSFGWSGLTTVHVVRGQLREVIVGRVLDAEPSDLVCNYCGHQGDPREFAHALGSLVEEQLSAEALTELSDDTTLWQLPQAELTRSERPRRFR